MYDVVALGELLIDFSPAGLSEHGNYLFEQNPGGAPANVLVACNRSGQTGAFIGMVGDDRFGSYLRDILIQNQIGVDGLKFSGTVNTTLAFVHLDQNGDRSFSFYRKPGADTMFTINDLKFPLIDSCKIFHFGSISMTHEPSRTTTIKAVEYAKAKGKLISYDPNYRPSLWDCPQQAVQQMRAGVAFADVLKVSDEELMLLTECDCIEAGAQKLLESGVQLICVTLGAKGCFYAHRHGTGYVPTYDVKVVDTTGSGDSFTGALLSRLLQGQQDIARLDSPQLEQIMDYANAAGALCAAGRGAIPSIPVNAQILQCQKTIRKL